MNNRLIIPYALAFAAVPLLTFGAWKREKSPRFDEWFEHSISQFDADPGLGLGIGSWWVFVGLVSLFIVVFVCVLFSLAVLLALNRRRRVRVTTVAVTITILCPIAIALFASSLDSLHWGFYALAIGKGVAASGAAFGILTILRLKPKLSETK